MKRVDKKYTSQGRYINNNSESEHLINNFSFPKNWTMHTKISESFRWGIIENRYRYVIRDSVFLKLNNGHIIFLTTFFAVQLIEGNIILPIIFVRVRDLYFRLFVGNLHPRGLSLFPTICWKLLIEGNVTLSDYLSRPSDRGINSDFLCIPSINPSEWTQFF